jgi:thioredoxin reductase
MESGTAPTLDLRDRDADVVGSLDSVVIGAGQAGLATSFFLQQRGVDHVVLDANPAPGGAWQHRWDSLTMADVHGVADLPGAPAPPRSDRPANQAVPAYFAEYEQRHGLPVVRPVRVTRVESDGDLLAVHAGDRRWRTRTLVNATGTWTRPFVPYYPGIGSFTGEQLHTVDFPGADHFRGRRVLVVGGGASAVQFLGELAPVTDTVWVTRRPPVWRDDDFDAEAGLAAVTRVEERVRHGLPPASVVSVTGLALRPQEQRAAELGAYVRRPMFVAIEPDGVRWADGPFESVDVILWATGFRPAVDHLAPLGLRSPQGGIALSHVPGNVQGATTAVADPRVQLVGYGPSASTVGASRAGRAAAAAVARRLASTNGAVRGR